MQRRIEKIRQAQTSASPQPSAQTAPEILAMAARHMEERAARYDTPAGERSMLATVTAFAAITGIEMTEAQGWTFMAMLKMARGQRGEPWPDTWEDGAAYLALAGEAATRSDPR